MHITNSFKLLCLSVAGQSLRKRGVGEPLLGLIKTHYWSWSVWVWVGVWGLAEPRAHLSEDSSSVLYSSLAWDPSGGHIKESCFPATLVFWRQQCLMTSLPLLFHSWTVQLMWSTIPQYVENSRRRKNLLNLCYPTPQSKFTLSNMRMLGFYVSRYLNTALHPYVSLHMFTWVFSVFLNK